MLKAQLEILYFNYGSEIYIIADYHFQIAQLVCKNYYNKDTGELIAKKDILFIYAFIFNISVVNQKIECQWEEITRSTLQCQRVSFLYPIYKNWLIKVLQDYFIKLKKEGNWNKFSIYN